jgi:hypothetical protein
MILKDDTDKYNLNSISYAQIDEIKDLCSKVLLDIILKTYVCLIFIILNKIKEK